MLCGIPQGLRGIFQQIGFRAALLVVGSIIMRAEERLRLIRVCSIKSR